MSAAHATVKSVAELKASEPEYQTAVRKIVRSHAVNELYGAQVYDEPAIALAPNPYLKWLTCRIAMEEYGHHVRFRQLGEQIGIPEEEIPIVLSSFGRGSMAQKNADEGSGLGLPIVIKILEDHSGGVELLDGLPRPDGGQGAQVVMTFPLRVGASPAPEAAKAPAREPIGST